MKKSAAARIPDLEAGLHAFLAYTEDEFCLPFLDQRVRVGRLAIEASHLKIAISPDELKQRLDGTDEDVQIPFTCSEGSACTLRQLTEDEWECKEGRAKT